MNRIKGAIARNRMAFFLTVLYILSLVPVLMVSIYAYPQADDWDYSHRVHLAWIHTHSLAAVARAVRETVCQSYEEWQGTFSSIALMSLQPGAFGERCYMLVPFLLIGLLTGGTLFFFRQLCRRVKGSSWLSVSMLVLLVTVQRMVSRPTAFFWYNGAVHYMAMYSFGLFLAGCLIGCICSRKALPYQIAACLLAILPGGGNLVTALSGAIGFAALLLLLVLSGRRKKAVLILPPALCYYAAFAVNVLAPGNRMRQDVVGEQSNPVLSILRSFYYGIQFPGVRWMDWVILLLILTLIPVSWKMARQVSFRFPCPLLAAGFSYCFLSAMFTPPDYAAHTVDMARVQNVIFSADVLLTALNVMYMTGWCEKNLKLSFRIDEKMKRIYYGSILFCAIWGTALFAVPSPEYFTTTLAIRELADGSAKKCGQTAETNIEILKGPEKEVELLPWPGESQLLFSTDIDRWHYGARLFYEKDVIRIAGEESDGGTGEKRKDR